MKYNIKLIVTKVILLLLLLNYALASVAQFTESIIKLEKEPWGPEIWKSKLPENCPVSLSKDLVAIEFTGESADYTYADTWYPSWASDGNLYSPFTDGVSGIWSLSRSNLGKRSVAGYAKIEGGDPLNLKIKPLGVIPGSALPYIGRYPCGSLVYNGVWYYGTYSLDDYPPGYNLGTLGPFVGFHVSSNLGKTWNACPHTPESPIFGESGKNGGVVKIGSPHFVDFGKNMQNSPDGKAYLVGHGAEKSDSNPRLANLSWISGDQIYLIRVIPDPVGINNPSSYEYFCGFDGGNKPIWIRDFSSIKPIFEWNNKCGCVTMTYVASLKKYIMCITDGWPTLKFMDTYFLESDNIEGPWKIITYIEHFGEQGYFVNIPSKFISDNGKSWLCYSGNFAPFADLRTKPRGGRYGLSLQEFRFLKKAEIEDYPFEENSKALTEKRNLWAKRNQLQNSSNLASLASVEVSSVDSGYTKEAIIDGIVDGFPNHKENEWASKGQTTDAWVKLTWDKKIKISKIWLFDRPTFNEHILAGGIILSDGTIMQIGELPNADYTGKEITFPEKEIEWLEFRVKGVGRAKNIGLSEIAVYK